MTPTLQRAPVEFPPGFDGRSLLLPTGHSAWTQTGAAGAAYRRHITKPSPLLFAVTYFGHLLRQSDTGVMSFASMHLDMCREAATWPDVTAGKRDAWVGPREIGKSAWLFTILPAWALAHGHRNYFLAFSFNAQMAAGQLVNVLAELKENQALRYDYPELAIRRGAGGGRTKLEGGATIAANGMGGTLLGTRSGADRPDLIVGDDLQPGEVDNSPDMVRKNESRLRRNVLPMNTRAVVQVTGTTTMRDDLIHPVVHAALGRPGPSWVQQERFTPHYYPAIQPDGSSLWPRRWPVAELEAMREADPEGFALNYQNDPSDTTGATWWTPDLFRYNEAFPTVERVIHIDGATTKRKRSDLTVLAMVGRDASGLRACVERVEWGRWDILQTRAKVWEFCAPLRRKPLVRIEGNQGGDTWLDSLAPWPEDVSAEVTYASIPKDMRIKRAHKHYRRRAVVHAWEMPELQAELCTWPNGRHDDVPDAIAGALQWAFG